MSPGNLRVECQNIHQVNQYNTPLSPRVSHARHTSSVLKLNSSQEDTGGETPYDSTIITKLAVHQDRAKLRTREREIERERDQTHSYWYIPSALRVNQKYRDLS